MTPKSLREAIRERRALAEAAHRPDLRPAWWNGGRGVVGLRAEVNTFIAAHDPSFMLRVYQEMEKTLDEHQPREGMLAGVVCAACPEPYDDYGCHLEWPCAPVRSVAAMLGMETE